MYAGDFVFNVARDFVLRCEIPLVFEAGDLPTPEVMRSDLQSSKMVGPF